MHPQPCTRLHLGQSKIRNLGPSIPANQNVQTLQVAMNHRRAPSVQVRAPKRNVVHERQLVLERGTGCGLHVVAQIAVLAKVGDDAEFNKVFVVGRCGRGRRVVGLALSVSVLCFGLFILFRDSNKSDNTIMIQLAECEGDYA
jgi:hypothetical protein